MGVVSLDYNEAVPSKKRKKASKKHKFMLE